jgi:hypothetical protein
MSLYQLFDLPHINQVHVFFRAELADLDFAVGVESLEVRLFEEHEIPWGELAFRTVTRTLECYYRDRIGQHYPIGHEYLPPMNVSSPPLKPSGIPLHALVACPFLPLRYLGVPGGLHRDHHPQAVPAAQSPHPQRHATADRQGAGDQVRAPPAVDQPWRAAEDLPHFPGQAAQGRQGTRRRQENPEGLYWLDWRKVSDRFNLAMHISYPNISDAARARREGVMPAA